METFSAKVRKIDINPYVQVPDDVLRKLQQAAQKERGPIPVKGTLQGKPFSTTVVRFRGMWRLYLNTPMRQAANVDVGDQVTVQIEFDGAARTVEAPHEFTQALAKNKQAQQAFEKLPLSRQKEILRYLNNLKQAETRERNIQKVIRYLQGQSVDGLVAVRRTKQKIRD